jgi:2-keto-4-pentenoate hydratase/2-oxohepta-3-ene-1,7-dioic acid hydratase in catechol pathway
MKLCTFEVAKPHGHILRAGAVTELGIVDLNAAAAVALGRGEAAAARMPPDVLGILQAGELDFARRVVEEVLHLGDAQSAEGETLLFAPASVRLRTPIPRPPSVRDFYAFEAHVKKGFEKRGEPMPKEWYEIPVYYRSASHNIIGTDEDVLWPRFTEKFDYELELAAVVGRRGTNVAAGDAGAFIDGYMVMNDFSARDIQRREMRVRLGPAKGKEWCTALGPVLATADEVGDPYALTMTARVNGEEWSRGNSGTIHWKFEQMIEFLTEDDTIFPGDVIGSGTVGTGCGLELDRWVKPGDVMELEIEKIGVLRNRVVKR